MLIHHHIGKVHQALIRLIWSIITPLIANPHVAYIVTYVVSYGIHVVKRAKLKVFVFLTNFVLFGPMWRWHDHFAIAHQQSTHQPLMLL